MAYAHANENPIAAAREYERCYPDAGRFPDSQVFVRLVNRLMGHGNIMPTKPTGMLNRAVDHYDRQLEELVVQQFRADPNVSTAIVAARLQVKNHGLVYRIAIENGFRPYKVRKVQKLMGDHDFVARRLYCQTFLDNLRAMPRLLRYILWTDECLFTPNGMFNAKNYVMWSDNNNPLAYRECRTQYK